MASGTSEMNAVSCAIWFPFPLQVDKLVGMGAPKDFVRELESLANTHHEQAFLDVMRACVACPLPCSKIAERVSCAAACAASCILPWQPPHSKRCCPRLWHPSRIIAGKLFRWLTGTP